MGMKTLRFRGVLCCIMASALLFTGLVCGGGLSTLAAVESVNGSDSLVRTSLTEIKNVLTSISYTDYLAMYESSGTVTKPTSPIRSLTVLSTARTERFFLSAMTVRFPSILI